MLFAQNHEINTKNLTIKLTLLPALFEFEHVFKYLRMADFVSS